MKRCTACERTFPPNAFCKNAARSDGLNSACRSCMAARWKRAAEDHREEWNAARNLARRARRIRTVWRTDKSVCRGCNRKLEVTAEFFYPKKGGGFSTRCKDCVRAKRAAHYSSEEARARHSRIKADPALRARKLAADKASYEKHKPKRLAATKQYRERPDIKAKRKAFDATRFVDPVAREEHKQYLRLYNAMRRSDPTKLAEIRAKARQWAKDNPEKAKAITRNRRARVRRAEGTHSADDVLRILAEQQFKCFWCDDDISGGKHTVDHYVPLARDGSNWPENIRCACATCNYSKGAMLPDEFLAYRASIADAENKGSVPHADLTPDQRMGLH